MRIALFSDIHANREAFEASLAHAREAGIDAVALLGDYVGYGADPEWSVDKVIELRSSGAAAVAGNHDVAVQADIPGFNPVAQTTIEWTRKQLPLQAQEFLKSLPMTVEKEDRLLVHAEASKPSAWNYVANVEDAARSLNATSAAITVCGHIHLPAIYSMSPTAKMTAFTPVTDVEIPLLPNRKWLIVLGSVGQPRDRNPMASYAILDTEKAAVTYRRAAYDIDTAAKKILKAGLPPRLAERLFEGR
ncbi:MAG: metallophosphoesterase family protein [Xanthobacteraceae bacterium]|nr:metallophosphoesterase family protein [Xanthobacteraceae bacterium]